MLVIREEPGQVAQLGLGAGSDRAAAVAIGTQCRAERQSRVAKLVDLGRGQGEYRLAASASSRS